MRGERGYTLLEVMMAIAISGFLVTIIGMAVQQVITVPERGSDQVDAIHPLQNAINWIALDGQMASSATGGSNLTLNFPTTLSVSYVRYGTDLNRVSASGNRTVASNVASANFTVQDKMIYLTIVTMPDSRWPISENKTYRVYMRPTV